MRNSRILEHEFPEFTFRVGVEATESEVLDDPPLVSGDGLTVPLLVIDEARVNPELHPVNRTSSSRSSSGACFGKRLRNRTKPTLVAKFELVMGAPAPCDLFEVRLGEARL